MSQSDCDNLKRNIKDRIKKIMGGDTYLVDAVRRSLNTAARKDCITEENRDFLIDSTEELAEGVERGQSMNADPLLNDVRGAFNGGNPHNNPNSNDDEDFGSLEPQEVEPERQRTLTGERAEGETGPREAETEERARGRAAFESGQETLGQSGTSRLTEFEEEEGNPNGGVPDEIGDYSLQEERQSYIEWSKDTGETTLDVDGREKRLFHFVVVKTAPRGGWIAQTQKGFGGGQTEADRPKLATLTEEPQTDQGRSDAILAAVEFMREQEDPDLEPRNTANFGGLILDLTTGVPEDRVNEMENRDRRARAERTIEEAIDDARISTGLEGGVSRILRESRIALGPAGSVMGVTVDLREDRVTGTALEQVVEVVDEAVEDVTGATIERRERVAPDRPEWEISCR